MNIREAVIGDIKELHEIRMAVKENILNTPGLVTEEDYKKYLTTDGKGWVSYTDEKITGFAIVDITENNIWALFMRPEYEGQGTGRELHDTMVDWFFKHFKNKLWLGTAANTRAAAFYRKAGWRETGKTANEEIRFELAPADRK